MAKKKQKQSQVNLNLDLESGIIYITMNETLHEQLIMECRLIIETFNKLSGVGITEKTFPVVYKLSQLKTISETSSQN